MNFVSEHLWQVGEGEKRRRLAMGTAAEKADDLLTPDSIKDKGDE